MFEALKIAAAIKRRMELQKLHKKFTYYKKCGVNRKLGLPPPWTFKGWIKKILLAPFRAFLPEAAVMIEPEVKKLEKAKIIRLWNSLPDSGRELIVTLIFFMIGTLLGWSIFVVSYNFGNENEVFMTIKCCLLLLFFSIGMAFVGHLRCIILIMIPVILSSRGRTILLTYLLLMTLNGPGSHIKHNLQQSWRSLKCTIDLLKRDSEETIKNSDVYQTVQKSLQSAKLATIRARERMKKFSQSVDEISKKFSTTIDQVKEHINKYGKLCKKVDQSLIDDCQNYYHSYQLLCYSPFFKYYCKKILYKFWGEYCSNLSKGLQQLKNVVCKKINVDVEPIRRKVLKPYQKLKLALNESLYWDVKVDYEFKFQIIKQKDEKFGRIVRKMGEYYKLHFGWIITIIKSLDILTYLLAFIWVYQAWSYTRKYRLYDAFDNQYINDDVLDIDWRRHKKGEPTIIPLTSAQRQHYISVWTFAMTSSEYRRLLIGLVVFVVVFVQIAFFVVLEFVVYFPTLGISALTENMNRIYPSHVIRVESGASTPTGSMIKEMSDIVKQAESDAIKKTLQCVPTIVTPNSSLLKGLLITLGLIFLTIVLEAYSLRMRHIIAGEMYPMRKKIRAAWLYSYILATKGSMKKLARRQLRQKMRGDDKGGGEMSFLARLAASNQLLLKIYQSIFGVNIFCIQCAKVGKVDDPKFVKCPNVGCEGIYCRNCQSELETPCVVCDQPINYGDQSDFDDELGSENEEAQFFFAPKQASA